MEKRTWRGKEGGTRRKEGSWYWAVGILAVGGAVASVIASNILLGVLFLLGGFAIMLAGSRPRLERHFAVSEQGVHIDAQIVPWEHITRFAIHDEDTAPILAIETSTLLGIVTLPLSGTDYRDIRMEFKNKNIEEADSLDSIVEGIAKVLGI